MPLFSAPAYPDGALMCFDCNIVCYRRPAALTYPDIRLESTAYAGVNRTDYSWAQKHEPVVMGKLHLNQILLNLLSKAIKYTPDGNSL